MGVLAELVDGDSVEPVRQVRGHAALRGRDREPAVAGGDLLRELGQGLLAGGAVDADALAGVAGGKDVSGGLPAAVLALVHGSVAVGADAAGGGGRVAWSSGGVLFEAGVDEVGEGVGGDAAGAA